MTANQNTNRKHFHRLVASPELKPAPVNQLAVDKGFDDIRMELPARFLLDGFQSVIPG